jgi:hypothetical protein
MNVEQGTTNDQPRSRQIRRESAVRGGVPAACGYRRASLVLPLVASLFVAGCGRGIPDQVAFDFQRAQRDFDNAQTPEDYLKAAALLESIRDRGVVSWAVLYNQGNAYMRAGERGRAIAAYREALRYRPRDLYLTANLKFAIGTETLSTNRPLPEYVLFWQNWIGYRDKYALAAAVAAMTFCLAVVGLWVEPRRLWIRMAIAGVFVTAVLAISAGYDWYRFDHQIHGVVVADEVVARKGNGESYKPAFADPLREGTEFTLRERRGDWLRIRLNRNQEGWVESRHVVTY